MSEHPQFSVIVPTHNRSRLLRRCVESVLAQTLPAADYEVIVVDDGSALKAARPLQACHEASRVRVLRQPQQGWALARQLGARHSRGDILVFLDDDCQAPPDWLAQVARVYAQHPEVDGVGGALHPNVRMNVAGRKQYLGHLDYFRRLNAPLHADPDSPGWVWFTFGGNRSFRRDIWWAAQPAATTWYFDDYAIDLKLRELGAHIYYAPAAWVTHHYALSVIQRFQAAYRYGRSEVSGVPSLPAASPPLGPAARWQRMAVECPTASLWSLLWYVMTQPVVWGARRAGQARGSWSRDSAGQ